MQQQKQQRHHEFTACQFSWFWALIRNLTVSSSSPVVTLQIGHPARQHEQRAELHLQLRHHHRRRLRKSVQLHFKNSAVLFPCEALVSDSRLHLLNVFQREQPAAGSAPLKPPRYRRGCKQRANSAVLGFQTSHCVKLSIQDIK